MNPQFNTLQISQDPPGKTTTHPQESKSKVLIPEEPHLIWQTHQQLGREGVGRLWELHILAMLDETGPTPRLLATALLMWHCTGKPGGAADRGRIYLRLLQLLVSRGRAKVQLAPHYSKRTAEI